MFVLPSGAFNEVGTRSAQDLEQLLKDEFQAQQHHTCLLCCPDLWRPAAWGMHVGCEIRSTMEPDRTLKLALALEASFELQNRQNGLQTDDV